VTTKTNRVTVGGIAVEVVRKNIKNLHLGVYPPNGRVRVAAPLVIGDEAVRLAIIGKLGWIKRQRAKFESQPRQSVREYVSGESHYYLGKRYRLRVHKQDGKPRIDIRNKSSIDLFIGPQITVEHRARIVQDWYRIQLRLLATPLLEHWQRRLGVRVSTSGIKKMKTKWGSCNTKSKRIWINLELVKKPKRCIEYIVVHELVHLLEPSHNDRFTALMDKYLPSWRNRRQELNAAPLGHDSWSY
jgi:predicted metal-dependent hydrolase